MKHKKHDRKYFMSVFMNGFEIIKKKWMLHDYDEKEESIFTSSCVLCLERDENSLIPKRLENEFWNSWDKTVVFCEKELWTCEIKLNFRVIYFSGARNKKMSANKSLNWRIRVGIAGKNLFLQKKNLNQYKI
jgi:hypothetical protein